MSLPRQKTSLHWQSSRSMHGQSRLLARAMQLHGQMPGLSPGYALAQSVHGHAPAKGGVAGAEPLHGHFFARASLGPRRCRLRAHLPRGRVTPYPGSPPFKNLQAPPSFGSAND